MGSAAPPRQFAQAAPCHPRNSQFFGSGDAPAESALAIGARARKTCWVKSRGASMIVGEADRGWSCQRPRAVQSMAYVEDRKGCRGAESGRCGRPSKSCSTRRQGAAFLIAAALCVSCSAESNRSSIESSYATPWAAPDLPTSEGAALRPLPRDIDLDARKVGLGRRAYADPRLSGDGKVSCASCHMIEKGGTNGLPRSELPDRPPVPVNVPTVFNAAFNFRFAWSGKFEDLAQQIDAAMELSAAMNGSWKQAVSALQESSEDRHAFETVYPEGLTKETLRDALAVYCLSLITPNSRFDDFLRGTASLRPDEQRGYKMFRDYGCISCHQGVNVGGNMYQRFGVMGDYFQDRGDLQEADRGLFNATGDPRDEFVFRVPSLRNVAITAPYFHDASAETLEEAVQTMAQYQLGRELSEQQARDIAAFLQTLTGALPRIER